MAFPEVEGSGHVPDKQHSDRREQDTTLTVAVSRVRLEMDWRLEMGMGC